jgi:hypothetical protein
MVGWKAKILAHVCTLVMLGILLLWYSIIPSLTYSLFSILRYTAITLYINLSFMVMMQLIWKWAEKRR